MRAIYLLRRRQPAKVFVTALMAVLWYAGCVLPLKSCPPCGNTTVPYPFSTWSDCGDQGYKIQCDGGTLMFPTSNNSYPITSISPSIQRFIVSPSPFLPNACVTSDISSIGMQLNATAPFNITGSNTIMFLNCTDSLLRSPLNCSSNSLCHVYVNSTRDASACLDAPICCTFRAGGSTTSYSIRVRDAGCRAYRSFVNLDPTRPASEWGRPGVEIQWVLPQEPECVKQADCDGIPGNATCMADTSSPGVRRCFCNSGLFWDSVNGLCTQNVTCQDPGGCDGSNRAPLIAESAHRGISSSSNTSSSSSSSASSNQHFVFVFSEQQKRRGRVGRALRLHLKEHLPGSSTSSFPTGRRRSNNKGEVEGGRRQHTSQQRQRKCTVHCNTTNWAFFGPKF